MNATDTAPAQEPKEETKMKSISSVSEIVKVSESESEIESERSNPHKTSSKGCLEMEKMREKEWRESVLCGKRFVTDVYIVCANALYERKRP